MGERPKTSVNAQKGRRTCGEKGGLDVLGVAGQVGHQERGPDQVALEVAEFDPAEFAAGLAGAVEVLHAVAPPDLRREQFRRGLDVPVQEVTEPPGVAHDLLVLLGRARDADGLLSPDRRGVRIGCGHGDLPAGVRSPLRIAEPSQISPGHPVPSPKSVTSSHFIRVV
jgi:hypothetical protein